MAAVINAYNICSGRFQHFLAVLLTCVALFRSCCVATEYCDWESFNISCPADQVIAITSARYGRMNLGRCVTTNYGSIGCGADVTPFLESTCSGHRTCSLSVISLSQIPLHTVAPCPPEFKYYLEADYECLKVYSHMNSTMPRCPVPLPGSPPSAVVLAGATSGLLASAVTMETGIGGPSCPWVIRVEPYQRINFTLLDFSVQASPSPSSSSQNYRTSGTDAASGTAGGHRGHQYRPGAGHPGTGSGLGASGWQYGDEDFYGTPDTAHQTNCDEYAILSEDFDEAGTSSTAVGSKSQGHGRNATICGRRRRQAVVYVSDTNVVRIRLNPSAVRSYRFVLKYEAIGCAPLEAPPGAWITNAGRHVYIQCNNTSGVDDESTKWRLTCRGSVWHGHVGNCTGSSASSLPVAQTYDKNDGDWIIGDMFGNNSNFPFGILFVIALGVLIGVIAGVLMLLAVLAYMRQRKMRKFRSRSSHYVIHETETTNGSMHSYDSAAQALKSEGHAATIYRPFVQDSNGTWQRTRPLPVPACRPTGIDTGSVNECDVDNADDDVIAMTPLTTASDLPLLTPTAATDPATPLFNITSGQASTDCQGNGTDYPDALRSFAASSTHQQRRGEAIYHLAPCQQQPVDIGHHLQQQVLAVSGPPEAGYERCNFGIGSMRPGSAHNMNAVGKRKGTGPGGPYYFKLDLTAGLNGGGGGSNVAQSSGAEHGDVNTPCLMCIQQQQQQCKTGTMQRRRVDSNTKDYSPVQCAESLRY